MEKKIFLEYKGDNGSIAVMRISRPECMNALNRDVINEMAGILDEIERNENVRAMIITGDKNFAAGADIDAMVDFTPNEAIDFAFSPVYNRIENLRFPTIAAVTGYALGGGLELALCCDFRLGSVDAVIGLPEINLGIMPGGGGTVRLTRIAGEARAKEMIYLGRNMNAEDAKSCGIFMDVVPGDQLEKKAVELAEKLCRKPQNALAAAKRMIQRSYDSSMYQSEKMEWGLLFDTEDQKEGMKAFLEKRKPCFKK